MESKRNSRRAGEPEGLEFLPLGVFLGAAISAFVLNWDLSDLCWGIWLTEVTVSALALVVGTTKICLAALGLRTLPPEEVLPDTQADIDALAKAPLSKRMGSLLVTLSFTAFIAFCIFGMYAFYSVVLYTLFPVPGVTLRQFSLLSLFIFAAEVSVLLLPSLWPVVLGSVMLNFKAVWTAPPAAQILGLGDRNLLKIHFSLLLLPPLTLIARHYLPNWQSVLTLIVLFVFFFPWRLRFRAIDGSRMEEVRKQQKL